MMFEPVLTVVIDRVTHDGVIMSRVLPVVLDQQPGTMYAKIELAMQVDRTPPGEPELIPAGFIYQLELCFGTVKIHVADVFSNKRAQQAQLGNR